MDDNQLIESMGLSDELSDSFNSTGMESVYILPFEDRYMSDYFGINKWLSQTMIYDSEKCATDLLKVTEILSREFFDLKEKQTI